MAERTLSFTQAEITRVLEKHPTPFHIYDEQGIRAQSRQLNAVFRWCPGFREYFAVKATPNPHILRIIAEEGCGADCSSLAELVLAECAGLSGEDIFFSSNDTPAEEFQKACGMGAIINLDDVGHIPFLEACAGLPELVSLRYNPGPLRPGTHIIGNPLESKFGMTREQLFAGYYSLRAKGVTRFGLHAMVVSNERNAQHIVDTAQMLFELGVELAHHLDIRLEFINIGGGIGIPYRPAEQPIVLEELGAAIRAAYTTTLLAYGLTGVKLFMECGRLITGPYGFLVTRVRHLKRSYKQYVGLDATMADLMRPGMYGAYHHLTVLGKEHLPSDQLYDVTGSLCENNDKFAIDRELPQLAIGDTIVIHDTGAHGHAMGFNYNGKLRSAELLLRSDHHVQLIRRRETLDDYFATLEIGD